jgi:hypothetical protein
MARYQYQPLNAQNNEIRLLHPIYETNPGALAKVPISGPINKTCVTPDLPMDFELRTVSQDDAPVYTALSYVWGDAKTSKEITVDGSALPITENLEVALHHMQYDDVRPAIWIDAICINQSDYDEKNDQVPRMSRIYSNARNVLIWLGPGTTYNDQHVRTLDWCLAFALIELRGKFPSFLNEHVHSFSIDSHKNAHCVLFEALILALRQVVCSRELVTNVNRITHWCETSLLASAWWYRVWTIQEFVLAKSCHFQIGLCRIEQKLMSFSMEVFSCVHLISRSEERPQIIRRLEPEDETSKLVGLCHGRRTEMRIEALKRDCGRNRKLFDILVTAYCGFDHRVGCSDPRDRVFALCSLAEKDYKSLGFQINYRKEPWQICIDVAQRIIRSGDLDILSYCRRQDSLHLKDFAESSHGQPSLPSWAVNWMTKIPQPHLWCGVDGVGQSLFSASGNTTPLISYNEHVIFGDMPGSCSMTFAAIMVGEICQVGRTDHGYQSEMWEGHVSFSREIQAVCKLSRETGNKTYTTSQLREAVWRIPIWDSEYRYSMPWRRATGLSKDRHDTQLHFGLANEASAQCEALLAERGKHGILGGLWNGILFERYRLSQNFHFAHYMPCSESFIYRLLYCLYIPIHLLFAKRTWLSSFQNSLINKTAESICPYLMTAERGSGNRLFLTQRGYIGLCPSTARPGDAVYILLGSRVPHVLRKRDNGQSGHTLLGDAFVYGAMDGELMKNKTSQVDVEIF